MKYWRECLFLLIGLCFLTPPAVYALDCSKLEDAQLAFMLSPLSDKKVNLARGEKYTEFNLLLAFGLPYKIESKAVDSNKTDPYVERTWYFKGLTIRAHSIHQYWVAEVTVQSPEIELKCGLRIGRPVSEFVTYLGEPKEEDSGSVKFDLEIPGFHPKYHRWMSAEIWLTVRDGRVESLRWEPGSGH